MFTPPRCRVCYDKLNIWSDITLGDPWGMSCVDWEHGDSLILTRTVKGAQLLKSAEEAGVIYIQHASKEEMLLGQLVNERRTSVKKFSQAYKDMPFAIPVPILEDDISDDYNHELEMLQTFVNTDTMCKEDIYTMAMNTIKAYERDRRFVNRLWRKVKKILHI